MLRSVGIVSWWTRCQGSRFAYLYETAIFDLWEQKFVSSLRTRIECDAFPALTCWANYVSLLRSCVFKNSGASCRREVSSRFFAVEFVRQLTCDSCLAKI